LEELVVFSFLAFSFVFSATRPGHVEAGDLLSSFPVFVLTDRVTQTGLLFCFSVCFTSFPLFLIEHPKGRAALRSELRLIVLVLL
jgi:hypothetical protein